ncbi:hypothetical protein, partial [Acinetobacter baumannii]|uniref:hypothetical protein n=1 Tax=Acinetobacter baumannii TaxID=470 RepID=UPI003395C987
MRLCVQAAAVSVQREWSKSKIKCPAVHSRDYAWLPDNHGREPWLSVGLDTVRLPKPRQVGWWQRDSNLGTLG